MNSIRQKILSKMEQCLSYIKTANGYHNTVKQIYKGFRSLNQTNEYPILFYGLGSENVENTSEDHSLNMMKCEAYIGVYFQSSDLTDEYEQWIRDLKRFIMQDRNVSDDKFLLLNEVDYISSWNITEIQPYMDYDKNIGSLLIMFDIEYGEGLETL